MLSVGELLRQNREKKGLTLKQIEKETKVRERFLQAVEENNWEIFTSKVYISGVIKSYAQAVGRDPNKMIAYFRRDYEKKEEVKFKQRVSKTYFHTETKKILIAVLVLIFLIFSAYFGYQVKLFLTPPSIVLTFPTKYTFRNIERIKVVGKTEKEASIVIFGEKVYPNKDGVFEYELPLQKGKNPIEIEVTGANGKKSKLRKEFVLE